ncbi:hypothetical protein ACLMJK_003588 [Lecanora helva]
MTLTSLLLTLLTLLLSFTLLSAGQAKLTSALTPHLHDPDPPESNIELYIPFSPSTRRKLRGILDVVCGMMLLWRGTRRFGAGVAAGLLVWSTVGRLVEGREGSWGKVVVMAGACGGVVVFG